MAIDEDKIKKIILSGHPLAISTSTLPRELDTYIEPVLTIILTLAGQEKLKNHIVYCVQELVENAKKANSKRVYFLEQGLDITNPDDYRNGMEFFKDITFGNVAHFLQKQREMGLYIKLVIQVRDNVMNIEVHNNAAVTRTELIRIHDRLVRARQFNSLEEALSQVLDDSEGAGLGLLILMLMLKKIGLNDDFFSIRNNNNETIAQMTVPFDKIKVENVSALSSAVVNNVNSLPQFSENIMKIQELLAQKDAEIADVARQISIDPALTADLLKVVNSAQYMLNNRVSSILDAVKMIGIQGIKNLLFSYGAQQILGTETTEKKQLWQHSYITAFYTYSLVKNFNRDSGLLDDAYVCGMLHDMGKIIFTSIHPELLENIKRFCVERNISVSAVEDLSVGMNHAEIGALIAEKWNFPENLIAAIRYHHNPSGTLESHRFLVDCVYLANMLSEYENENVTFDQFDSSSLTTFSITNKKQLDVLLERLSEGFKKEFKQ